jgi:LacI family transcriptional regulator
MMRATVKTKYESLADDLKKRILATEPGAKLPSVRDIVRESGVSQFTVSRAMDLLEEEGYIRRRATTGIFSSRPDYAKPTADTETQRILILSASIAPMEFLETLTAVVTERGYLWRHRHYDLREPAEKWVPRVRHEAMIFLGSCPPEVLPILRRGNRPFVCQGLRYTHQEVDNTCGDERMAGAIAAQHLVELGHRRIAVLWNEPHVPDCEERMRGFVNQAKLLGAHARVIDCRALPGCDAAQTAIDAMSAEIEGGTLDFTGVFVISDKGATGVLRACHLHGIRVPQQLSVIGCDNLPYTQYLCPSLTTLEYSYRERANGLIDIIEKRLAGDSSPSIQQMYEPTLIQRESSGPAPA